MMAMIFNASVTWYFSFLSFCIFFVSLSLLRRNLSRPPLSSYCLSERNETRSVIRIKVLHILSFVLSTNRQLYEVCMLTHLDPY